MIESITEYTNFLIKEKISPSQYYFILLVATQDDVNKYKYIENGTHFLSSEINDLLARGLITTPTGSISNDPDDYEVADSVKERFVVINTDPGLEFWDLYPNTTLIQSSGRKAPLKGVVKEEFIEYYNRLVNKNLTKHRRIMRALNFARAHQRANIKIDTWLKSEMWKDIESEFRLGEVN